MTSVFESPNFSDHEEVVFISEPDAQLKAIISVHSTARGPSAGGCRLWTYTSSDLALEDALRLSAGMTFKNAMADLPLGGGKAVVMAPASGFDRQKLFAALGDAIERLNGRYVTAEDVGVSPEDLAFTATRTEHVAGLATGPYASGDPSPVTARGVFQCLLAGAERVFGTDDLSGKVVALQGLGHVGWDVAQFLANAGAKLIVSDIADQRQKRAADTFGAQVFTDDDITLAPADILVPCALGGTLTVENAARVQAKLICGAANNQLATPEAGDALHEAGVLYLPDYVVNAGGIINVAKEILKVDQTDWVDVKVDGLRTTIGTVLNRAEHNNQSPARVADELARERAMARP